MSLGRRIAVDAGMYRDGATPKVGYMNGNDGATPLCHIGKFQGLAPIITLSADFSSYSARHATDRTVGTTQELLS